MKVWCGLPDVVVVFSIREKKFPRRMLEFIWRKLKKERKSSSSHSHLPSISLSSYWNGLWHFVELNSFAKLQQFRKRNFQNVSLFMTIRKCDQSIFFTQSQAAPRKWQSGERNLNLFVLYKQSPPLNSFVSLSFSLFSNARQTSRLSHCWLAD